MTRALRVAACVLGLSALAACQHEKPQREALPSASAASSTAPATVVFSIEPASSRVTLRMDSPLEKIYGEAPGSVQGELLVDLNDLTKSTGLVKVALDQLVLFQEARKDEKHDYAERKKNEGENKDAREWLQLEAREGEIAAEQAERNRFPEFRIERLENASATSIAGLSGPRRDVGATARGEFLLHGRKNKKSAKVELRFEYSGDQVQSVFVKTSEPFKVALEDYDIHPRSKTGKLLKTISEALSGPLGKKLASEAQLELEFTAKPH
jgi:hypothetical protein